MFSFQRPVSTAYHRPSRHAFTLRATSPRKKNTRVLDLQERLQFSPSWFDSLMGQNRNASVPVLFQFTVSHLHSQVQLKPLGRFSTLARSFAPAQGLTLCL